MTIATRLLTLPLLLLAFGAGANAACNYPQAPQSLPNGSKATEEQMRAAQGEVNEYLKAIQEVYLPCLEQDKLTAIASLDQGDTQFESQKRLIDILQAKKHDAALDELQALADRWNQELKAYTQAQKK